METGRADKKPQIIPVCLRFKGHSINCNPPEVTFRLFQDLAPFIFESACGENKEAKYSLIGLNPVLRIKAEPGNQTTVSGLKRYTRTLMPLFMNSKACSIPRSCDPGSSQDKKRECFLDPFISGFSHEGHDLCNDSEIITFTDPDPISKIHQIMDLFEFEDSQIPGYQGGLTGYFSYDLVYSLFETVNTDKAESKFPLADFIMTSEYILYDHPAEEVYIFSLALVTDRDDAERVTEDARLKVRKISEKMQEYTNENVADPGEGIELRDKTTEFQNLKYCENLSKGDYEDLVRKTKEYIFSGEIFQGVISKRNECRYEDDPFLIYSALRRINPGPYMYYINYVERQIAGSSPEMLVKVENNQVTTVPIAGTGKRGHSPEEDEKLGTELLSDEKECAEHLMLVDLARNDLGRVCEYGTVHVDEFMKIEKFSHVQHIVSRVSGDLKNHLTPADAFKSCFPAGTLTGAPKIRAMQIIDELESERRGLYGGAVGHIGLDRKTDFAIAIRTLVCEDGRLTFQAGAGIVADSDPEKEYEESEKKACAIADAISIAKGGHSL